ncbi:MAG: TatD family hydrolase [Dehalococcoidia bacterium]
MTGAFDTHCHIQDPKLLADFDGVVGRARRAGLSGMALCGYDAPSNELALDLAQRSPLLFPTVGFHPHEADDVTPAMLADLESQARLKEVVAIGEIGLDSYRNLSSEANQRKLIDAQLEIALRVDKPVCVHSRSAEDVIFEHLGPYAARARTNGMDVPGVMHCFGGTYEQARRYLDAGFVVSIACTITYPKNETTTRLAQLVPLEALVIETDSPYLPPQTRRGKLNEPAYVVEAARAIAEVRGEPFERVLEATTENAQRLFRVQVASAVGAA